jgi:hypothetical protein
MVPTFFCITFVTFMLTQFVPGARDLLRHLRPRADQRWGRVVEPGV